MKNILYIFAISIFLITLSPVQNSHAAKKIGNPKYASVVVDADTGKILFKDDAEKRRHPASLTKMMTLYMTFEALKAGKLSWHQRMKISKEAASRPQTNLSLKAGNTIRVRDAVLGLIIRSANDAAVVLAEQLGRTEPNFARMMTQRARSLGMKNTTFKNASGLHHSKQVTTAKDMALLAIALKKHYKQYYPYFSRTSMTYNGRKYRSHNNVMKKYAGADGLKTGYVNASGFNLVTSAKRRGQNIVGVVMGGKTAKRRDNHMIKLLDSGFTKLAEAKTNRYVKVANLGIAKTKFVPKPISKGYWREGGYKQYIKLENAKKIAGNNSRISDDKNEFLFVPFPKDKPRVLAQAN